jgi:hypothetical protein
MTLVTYSAGASRGVKGVGGSQVGWLVGSAQGVMLEYVDVRIGVSDINRDHLQT